MWREKMETIKPRSNQWKTQEKQQSLTKTEPRMTVASSCEPIFNVANGKMFKAFSGMGCVGGAVDRVSVPIVLRSSRVLKKKMLKEKLIGQQQNFDRKNLNIFGENDKVVRKSDDRNSPSPPSIDLPENSVSDYPARSVGRINICERSKFDGKIHRNERRDSSPRELMESPNNLLTGGHPDQFSAWRLDIDHMSYEQLLELGDRIGYVVTGLKEEEILRSITKLKCSLLHNLGIFVSSLADKKCIICQEEYEVEDEMGKLECGHGFHLQCVTQWLLQKNSCPVCKRAVVP